LTNVAETYEVRDAKNFFEQYYSHVYFLFHEGFTNVEASLAQRGNAFHSWNNYLHSRCWVAGWFCLF